MAAPTAPSLSHLFTQLTGRAVAFAQIKDYAETEIPQVYGVYEVFPDHAIVVVKADLPLLGSFAGALIGLPASEVKAQLRIVPMEESLRDAIYEVLNIASSTIAPLSRTTLSKVATDLASLDAAASSTLAKPDHKYCFDVTVNGYDGGKFAVSLQLAPVPNEVS
jgi:hypothetical protein